VLGRRQRLRRTLVLLRVGDALGFLRPGASRGGAPRGGGVDGLLFVGLRRQILRRALSFLGSLIAGGFRCLALAGVGAGLRSRLHFLLLRLVLRRLAGLRGDRRGKRAGDERDQKSVHLWFLYGWKLRGLQYGSREVARRPQSR